MSTKFSQMLTHADAKFAGILHVHVHASQQQKKNKTKLMQKLSKPLSHSVFFHDIWAYQTDSL